MNGFGMCHACPSASTTGAEASWNSSRLRDASSIMLKVSELDPVVARLPAVAGSPGHLGADGVGDLVVRVLRDEQELARLRVDEAAFAGRPVDAEERLRDLQHAVDLVHE